MAVTPNPSPKTDAAELARTLDHVFAAPELLQAALTHPSLSAPKARRKSGAAYERLEFLGDRVLGLVIAEWLYQTYPDSAEGDLAKRHAALVNRDALRLVATEIGLGQFIKLARGETTESARKNLATLSDAMEAVLGALYLDGGLDVARRFIQRHWHHQLERAEAPADPKTTLQEWAQGHHLPLPVYKVVEHSGPAHAPHFVIEATVKGYAPVTATGDSKRAAEKSAATLLLQQVQEQSAS